MGKQRFWLLFLGVVVAVGGSAGFLLITPWLMPEREESVIMTTPTVEQGEQVDAEELIRLGDEAFVQKQYMTARSWYKEALQQNPDDVDTREKLALLYERNEDFAQALQMYQFALDAGAVERGRIWERMGHLSWLQEQCEQALLYYEQAVSLDQRSVLATTRRGQCLLRMSEFDEAKDAFGKALEMEQEAIAPRYYYALVGALYDVSLARLDMEKVIDAMPTTEREAEMVADAPLFIQSLDAAGQPGQESLLPVHIGKMFLRFGVPTLARAVLEPFVSEQPNYPPGQLLWGRTLSLLQGYGEAEKVFARYMAVVDDSDAVAWFYRGENYYFDEDIGEAVLALEKAVDFNEDSESEAVYLLALAEAYEALPSFSEAAATYAEVTGHNPAVKKAWLQQVALALLELNASEQAVFVGEQAREHFPEDVDILNVLGWAYREHGQYDEARGVLQKAIELAPEFAPPYYNLGLTEEREGNSVEAKELLNTAVQLDKEGWIGERVRAKGISLF